MISLEEVIYETRQQWLIDNYHKGKQPTDLFLDMENYDELMSNIHKRDVSKVMVSGFGPDLRYMGMEVWAVYNHSGKRIVKICGGNK